MNNTQLVVSFSLNRGDTSSYQHRASVALDADDIDLLIEQLTDLKSEYPDLRVEKTP